MQSRMFSLGQEAICRRSSLKLAPKICFDSEALLEEKDPGAGSHGSDEAQFVPLSERSESNMQTAITGMMGLSRVQETRMLLRRPSAQVKQGFKALTLTLFMA